MYRNLHRKKLTMVKTSEHPGYCKKESELGKLRAEVDTLKSAVMGNGQPGLMVTVPRLAESVERFEQTAGEFATAVRGFHQFQENQLGQEKGKETIRKRNRWLIGIIITVLATAAGVLAGIHFGSC